MIPSTISSKKPLLFRKAAALIVLSGLSTTPAWPNDLIVNSLSDDIVVSTGDGQCTLREAVTNANSNSDTSGGDCATGAGADIITFSMDGTIVLKGTLTANDAAGLTVDASGHRVILSGNTAVRVMQLTSGANLTLNTLTVANGFVNDHGAGIYNQSGTLAVFNSTFFNNNANDNSTGAHYGGGIANEGTLTVVNSTFFNNRSNGGGAIKNINGTLTVTNSTIAGNIVTNHICPPGKFCGQIVDEGGGIQSSGNGMLHIDNSIVVGNTAPAAPDISGSVATASHNLIGDPFVSYVWDGIGPFLFLNGNNGNIAGFTMAAVLSTPLANNGGHTQTLALIPGSPAIDVADDALCANALVNKHDQRGVKRTQGAHCDMGAYEFAIPADLAITGTLAPNPVMVGDLLTLTINVINHGVANATNVKVIDTLPASGLTFVSVSPSQGICDAPSGGTNNCNLGNINYGNNATITVKVIPTTAGTLTNTATVSGEQLDNQLANNTLTQAITVQELLCKGLKPTIVGTPGPDILTGNKNSNVIHGLGGNDTIKGGDGNDIICGGEGQDSLSGDNGNDTLDGGAGSDTCNGGKGTDSAINCEARYGTER